MDHFNEYIRIPDFESLKSLTAVLEEHGISYEVDDSAVRLNLSLITGTGNPWDHQYILKIREADFSTVDNLLKDIEEQFFK
jgi:hypothetical protein